MSRKEKIDLFLSKWISRKLIVFFIASVALLSGSIESNDWVIVATAYIYPCKVLQILLNAFTIQKNEH